MASSSTPFRMLLAYGGMAAVVIVIAAVGGAATSSSVGSWYETLAKPWFNPPRAAFPIAWTILYAMIAISGARLILAQAPDKRAAYLFFAVQLALNFAWSLVFFGMRWPIGGLVVILALLCAILATIVALWPIDRFAAVLLAPYGAWVAFASVLNGAIVALNS